MSVLQNSQLHHSLVPSCHTAAFDFAQMAQEAQQQREILRQRIKQRHAAGPPGPDQEFSWNRQNAILYKMYLEQRSNYLDFSRRASSRGQTERGPDQW